MKIKLLKPKAFFKGDKTMPAGAIVGLDNASAQRMVEKGEATADLKAALPKIENKQKPSKPE